MGIILKNTWETDSEKIPLDIEFPKNLKLKNKSRFFVYFPNAKEFKLSSGKIYEKGFWSTSYKEMQYSNILKISKAHIFQFLLIYKSFSSREFISNIHYKNKKLNSGPFINVRHDIINENKIELEFRVINPKKRNIKFEIEGTPKHSTITDAKKMDDNLWEIVNKKKAYLELTENHNEKVIQLTITATDMTNPKYKSTFNLVIDMENFLDTKIY